MPTRTFVRRAVGFVIAVLFLGHVAPGLAQPQPPGNSDAADFSDPVHLTLEIGKHWVQTELDRDADKQVFHRYAAEGGLRDVFVLTCEKARNLIQIEVVPPKQMLPALERRVGNAEVEGRVQFVRQQSTTSAPGVIDQIAAFVTLRQGIVSLFLELLDDPEFHIFFFDKRFGYGFQQTVGAINRIRNETQSPDFARLRGKADLFTWQDVQLRCLRTLGSIQPLPGRVQAAADRRNPPQ